MVRIILLTFVILFSVYLTEQASFLSQDYIDEINYVATTWKVSNCNICICNTCNNNCRLPVYYNKLLVKDTEYRL
jgi:hypothetical protein